MGWSSDVCGETECHVECCFLVALPNSFVVLKKDSAVVPFKKLRKKELGSGVVSLMTGDGFCPWLDRETGRCVEYESRPRVCKKYGTVKELQCPYRLPSGVVRDAEEVEKLLNRTMYREYQRRREEREKS